MEFEIQGQTRGFKLGTYTFQLINRATGTKTIEEVFKRFEENSPEFTSAFYFCCAQHWAMSNRKEIDFEEVHVTDWLDELGLEEVKRITQELFRVYVTKNLRAPETGLLQSSNGRH